jgi:beta-mannosidase
VVDSALRPKAGYYFAKKFFSPVLLSFKRIGNTLEVWVTNDMLKDVDGKIELSLRSFVKVKGVWRKSRIVKALANSSLRVLEIEQSQFAKYDSTEHYFSGRLLTADGISSENRYFLHEPKRLHFPKAKVSARLSAINGGLYVVTLSAATFVKNLRLEILGADVMFDDNYFDLDAGSVKRVQCCSARGLARLKKNLRLRWF